jgi:hypothetical protein
VDGPTIGFIILGLLGAGFLLVVLLELVADVDWGEALLPIALLVGILGLGYLFSDEVGWQGPGKVVRCPG